ncbi:hypothetical protein C7N43_38280 [Sphingobacteriales bacterium UPWRP_1]|nr:hypothetical protein C7N43_38280 [Sphingobacteriales bacterium UPWRP_1]
MILHPCQLIYKAAGLIPSQTGEFGICRITGTQNTWGVSASEWLNNKEKFNDHNCLRPGNIISHEALFCFDEQSMLLAQKTGRDKPQRFRTYCHLIDRAGDWHVLTKADKKLMYEIIANSPQLVCLTDTGQKHLLFKHRNGFWQLDENHITPNTEELVRLHGIMMQMLQLGFSQTEIQSGKYYPARVTKAGLYVWRELEEQIKNMRNYPIFDLAAWLMYNINNN